MGNKLRRAMELYRMGPCAPPTLDNRRLPTEVDRMALARLNKLLSLQWRTYVRQGR